MTLELLLTACAVFVADQTTKAVVARRLGVGQFIGSRIKIRRVPHAGGRFLHTRPGLLVLGASALACLTVVLRHGHFFQHAAAPFALGAALGGASSNAYDWLRRGVVIDFLDFGVWPVFNLADVAITLGVALALWFIR